MGICIVFGVVVVLLNKSALIIFAFPGCISAAQKSDNVYVSGISSGKVKVHAARVQLLSVLVSGVADVVPCV